MSKTFQVNVNNTYNIELSENDIASSDIVKENDSKFHIILDNKTYKAKITESNFNNKSYKVKVNDREYNVNINNELDVLLKQMGFEVGASKKVNVIKAPMPGLILEVNIKKGQEVKEDDALLILEAMKMENVINSPRDGIIKSISVEKGDAVEKNQLLIEFE